jgi:dTDP-4-dehydrorhamnose reductase
MRDGFLITGGSGLLAVNWAAALRERGPVTLGLHERSVSLAGAGTRTLSLASVDEVERAIDAVAPRVLVHTAGLANVELCEEDQGRAEAVNVDTAVNVAIACASRAVPLIHVSTDHVFRGDEALSDESQPVDALNVYGRTKAKAERRVLEAYPAALVVRTNFYGWGPRYRRSFSDTIIDTLRRGEAVTLFADVFFTPILAESLALAAHDLIERQVRGIVHVVGDERLSKHEFGLRIAKRFQLDAGLIRPGALADRPSLVRRPLDMSLSNGLARRLLGRPLGDVDAHLARLQEQEQQGLAGELQTL